MPLDPRVSALLDRGVAIPRPELVVVEADVDPKRIEEGATILPGARLAGPRTLIGRGSRIGTAGSAVVRDCAIGRGVELASGCFEGAVFLDGASFGPGGQARGGTLFEEGARAAHTVGTKHTILLPFATLGSLINFCDCLMAGGSGDDDHSEVGSGFIHFNFTPAGDKATPSLFGDVPQGVFLRSRRIFLGGHAGVVGPLRVGFGSVLAAGAVFRRDVGENLLVMGEPLRAQVRPFDAAAIRGARAKVARNFEYLGELAALRAFYENVRVRLAGSDAHRLALAAAGVAALTDAMAERVRQLDKWAALLARSAATVGGAEADYQAAFGDRLRAVRARLLEPPDVRHEGRDVLLRTVPAAGGDYLAWVRELPAAAVDGGVAWLRAVRDACVAITP